MIPYVKKATPMTFCSVMKSYQEVVVKSGVKSING